MTEQATIDTQDAIPAGALADHALESDAPRDYEAEARHHGWTPRDEFKGDESKWVDAETFVKRADEVMPFLKKQNSALKREIDDMKRTMKQFQEYHSKTEQRAYQQALADIEARHTEAVEMGDTQAAKRAIEDMRAVEKDYNAGKPETPDVDDQETRRQELAEWVEETGWYGIDEAKTKYADLQASLMGLADNWPGGQKAWLAELAKRTERKFADAKPTQANPGGGRPSPKGGAKGYADLPADAKRQCDRFVKTIPGFTREQYVKDFQW